MKIGIIGFGVVGQAVSNGLQGIGHRLSHYDLKDNTTIDLVLDTELLFVCVPTNSTAEGRCDTSIVEQIVDELVSLNYQGIIAIKSTIAPGTTDRLIKQHPTFNICCTPEFLRQRSADSDFSDYHDVLVIGSYSEEVSNVVISAHGIIPKFVATVTPIEAEVIKYFNNVHNSMEIVFANAMHEMCKLLGANYQNVLSTISKRSNINSSYLRCSDYYKGFSGHCLPKDTLAWKILAEDLGVNVNLFNSIIEDNRRYQ